MKSVVQSAFNDCALNITIVRLNTMVSFNAKIELRQHNFHLKIDNFTKVYVFVEDLAVRKMYVDLDILLGYCSCSINVSLYFCKVPSVTTQKLAANPFN